MHASSPNGKAIRIVRQIDVMASSFTRGHAELVIDQLRVPADQMLGNSGDGFTYAQVRLAPARLSHCMRWLGACIRANSSGARDALDSGC